MELFLATIPELEARVHPLQSAKEANELQFGFNRPDFRVKAAGAKKVLLYVPLGIFLPSIVNRGALTV